MLFLFYSNTQILINMNNNIRMRVQYILLKLKWFKSEEDTLGCLFYFLSTEYDKIVVTISVMLMQEILHLTTGGHT